MKRACCAALLLLVTAAASRAETAWRPFPDLPQVFFYDDFEGGSESVFEKGRIVKNATTGNSSAYELGATDWSVGDRIVWGVGHLSRLPLKMPGGADPNLISINFMLWSDDPGVLIVKLFHPRGDYEVAQRIQKANLWTPVSVPIMELRNGKFRPEADHACTKLEIQVRPRDKRLPTVYIDNVMICMGNAAQYQQRLQTARNQMAAMARNTARDGFSFSQQYQTALKDALKMAGKRRKPRTVLVTGARLNNDVDLITRLTQAAQKQRAGNFTFVAASAPDAVPVAGLQDLRTLLLYNLQKTEAEMVLLVMQPGDYTTADAVSRGLRVCLERTLTSGAVPVVCLPAVPSDASGDVRQKSDALSSAASAVCAKLAVPWIEPGTVLANAPDSFAGGQLSAAGVERLSVLAVQTLRHMDQYVFGRK